MMVRLLRSGLYALSQAFLTLSLFHAPQIAEWEDQEYAPRETGAEMFNKVWCDVGKCMNEAVDIVVYNSGDQNGK